MQLPIIGTSHIARESILEIKKAIREQKPDLIAVELDLQRAAALLREKKRHISLASVLQVGLKGYIFASLGQAIQQKLGKMVGVSPGSEMKTALEIARKQEIEVAFIDQPLAVTLRNFSKQLTWKERWRFFLELVQGIFSPKKELKRIGLEEFDLHKVPEQELIAKLMGHLKKQYPSVYKTLVEDRNKYMVKQLVQLVKMHPEKKILVIVGAGHKEGMEELLRKIDVVR